jgi:hypothetical protein
MKKIINLKCSVILCLLFLLIGCQTKSTPKGVFKSFDLKSKLPEQSANISPTNTKEFSKEISVGNPPEKVIIKWQTFQNDDDFYIVSVTIEVPEELKNTQLTNAEISDPINRGTTEKIVQMNNVLVSWDSSKAGSTTMGTSSASFSATGDFTEK